MTVQEKTATGPAGSAGTKTYRIAAIPADGIGPEVIAEARRVAEIIAPDLSFDEGLVGGASIDVHGEPPTVDTLVRAKSSAAVLLGAVGGLFIGLYYRGITFNMGWQYGLYAFIAAILGGIGNIPGAMVGGILLGIVESLGPAALGIDFQLKDVIAFSILVLILIFRPSGIVGEVLSEEKV